MVGEKIGKVLLGGEAQAYQRTVVGDPALNDANKA
jgi:hypothetical protein